MDQLYPDPATVADDLLATIISADAAVERVRVDRPWISMVMISSLDGSAVLDGRAGTLGNEADKRAFTAMRFLSDAIVVGAETVRIENYGPPTSRPEVAEWRSAKGLEANPLLVVISGTLDFEPNTRLFDRSGPRPLIITDHEADPQRLATVREMADVVQGETVTPEFICSTLATRNVRTIALEGGPGLNSEFSTSDLIDEIQLSISPKLVGGEGPRIIRSTGPIEFDFDLAQLWVSGGLTIGRYVRTSTS